MATRKVLVTGSAGRLGRAAVAALVERGHTVLGLDVAETPGLPAGQGFVGSITDAPLLKWLMKGVDCVIHLAAVPDDAKDSQGAILFDRHDFLHGLLPNNVAGPYHVLEAARAAQVPRVVLASSGQVIDDLLPEKYEPGVETELVTDASPYRPLYLYACTKVFLEALGRVYARHHALSVLAVRLGWCPRDEVQRGQIAADPVSQDVYLSPGDAGRFFVGTVEAAGLPPFAVVYATSRPTHRTLYDLSGAATLLGYEPRDQWPHE